MSDVARLIGAASMFLLVMAVLELVLNWIKD